MVTTIKKKTKFETGFPIDFELIGIVSQVKEYKLAWNFNQLPKVHLVKAPDIQIDFNENHKIRVSNLKMEDDFKYLFMLKNKVVSTTSPQNKFLLPEFQQFDYFLKLSNQVEVGWANYLSMWIKSIPAVDYSVIIDVEKVKMRENLFF